jgi:hypothetical protein
MMALVPPQNGALKMSQLADSNGRRFVKSLV